MQFRSSGGRQKRLNFLDQRLWQIYIYMINDLTPHYLMRLYNGIGDKVEPSKIKTPACICSFFVYVPPCLYFLSPGVFIPPLYIFLQCVCLSVPPCVRPHRMYIPACVCPGLPPCACHYRVYVPNMYMPHRVYVPPSVYFLSV